MNDYFQSTILRATGATSITHIEEIQALWSGYGQILRIGLKGADIDSVVVKHVQTPKSDYHPRGWNTNIGHQRKLKSYEVETYWYENYSQRSNARLPNCLAVDHHEDEVLIILEDLNTAGFPLRKRSLNWTEIEACLQWLAQFHACFLGTTPNGLWESGTYWHLETRPQELEALTDSALKKAAQSIDKKLNDCEFKTLVHGDAKLANFCFGEYEDVAAVDFQYVGGGCGMKDVAYFVGSCLNEQDSERYEDQILDTYFSYLQSELESPNEALEKEWRALYRVAWADFHRFLKGWSPGHWKINTYSERITHQVINSL